LTPSLLKPSENPLSVEEEVSREAAAPATPAAPNGDLASFKL